MSPLRFQNVRAVLLELQEEPAFKALWDNPDNSAQRFRRAVDRTATLCMLIDDQAPTISEVDDHLEHLQSLCVGGLQRFERFIVQAREALHAG